MPFSRRLFIREENFAAATKKDLLSGHRVLCPKWPGSEPHYRTSWERLVEADGVAHARMLDWLKRVPDGGDGLAHKYEARAGASALHVFIHTISVLVLPRLLEQLGAENRAEAPFDLDAFIVVDDELAPRVILEIFPRSYPSEFVHAFASRLRFEAPIAATEAEGEGAITATLAGFVLFERLDRGELLEAIGHDWRACRDLWPITRPDIIALFLNACAFSQIESLTHGGVPMNLAQVELECGQPRGGIVTLTRTRRH